MIALSAILVIDKYMKIRYSWLNVFINDFNECTSLIVIFYKKWGCFMQTKAQKPGIVIFSTGGTILSQMNLQSGVVKPSLTGEELLSTVPGLEQHFTIFPVEFSNKPGSDLTLEDGFALAKEIVRVQQRPEVQGVVVLQGTDTMDEIPYLVDLLVDTQKPVVFTGAMKSMLDVYADATGNVLGAAMVATAEQSKNKGVLVYFNETIFAASELMKAHSSRIDAFDASYGPLGGVINGAVHFVRTIVPSPTYVVDRVDDFVPLFKVHAGMDNRLLTCALEAGAQGLVLEGYGSGNVPITIVNILAQAVADGIPVVVATRCMKGNAYACYGYTGGGAQLEQLGVVLAGSLSGIKSRIHLIVLLAAGTDATAIAKAFANQ